MQLILLLAGQYSACMKTRDTWLQACHEQQLNLEVYNLDEEQGISLSQQYNVKSFPALICNGNIVAVGHPDPGSARQILGRLLDENN